MTRHAAAVAGAVILATPVLVGALYSLLAAIGIVGTGANGVTLTPLLRVSVRPRRGAGSPGR